MPKVKPQLKRRRSMDSVSRSRKASVSRAPKKATVKKRRVNKKSVQPKKRRVQRKRVTRLANKLGKLNMILIGLLIIFGSVALISWWRGEGKVLGAADEPKKIIPEVYTEPLVVSQGLKTLSIVPVSGKRVRVKQQDVRYIYEGAYKNTDVIQFVYPYKIKEELVFYEPGHPLKFRYNLGNWESYIIKEDEEGNIIFYDKVEYDNSGSLARVFTIPTPFIEDKVGKRSFSAVKTVIGDGWLEISVDSAWLKSASYPVVLDPTVEINVINLHSHPEQGEQWVVEFTTQGKGDLKIIPNDQRTVYDDEFVSLSCAGVQKQPQILAGDVIYYPDWECEGTAKVVHKTLFAGDHTLRFEFGPGDDPAIAYAYNGNSEVKVATGTFTTPGSTGSDSVTGVGFQPKAVIFYGVPRTDENPGSHASWFIGFSDGTASKCSTVESEDGANDSGRYQQSYAINLHSYNTTVLARATVSSFDSDGFTLSYDTANSGYVIHYVAFGGNDVEAEVGEKLVNASPLVLSSGTLEPDIMFLNTTGNTYEAAENTNGIIAYGVVGGGEQWYIGGTHGSNSLVKDSLVTDNGCLAQVHANSKTWEMTSCTLTSTGMSWSGSNTDEFGYLALDLGDNEVAVDLITKEVTGADEVVQNITGWDFDNGAAVVGFASAAKTDETVSDNAFFNIGAYDGTNQGVISVTDDVASTDSDSVQNNDYAIAMSTSTANIIAGGTASDLDEDGVSLTWSPNNTTGFYMGYWAIEGELLGVYQSHYRWRDDSVGLNTDNGWLETEDTSHEMTKGTTYRLRFQLDNLSDSARNNYQYRLEYASYSGGICGEFSAVPATASGGEPFEMMASGQYSDGDNITSNLLTASDSSWANGKAVEDPSNKTANFSLAANYYTEMEYALKATDDATDGGNYCFRMTNDGDTTNFTYNQYAVASIYLENPWNKEGWSYRQELTFDNSNSSENLVDFPVLIHLDADNFDFTKAQDNGEDIRFLEGIGSTELEYEIEDWDNSGQEAWIWVKVDQIDSGSITDLVTMYYGNDEASSNATTTGVWDENFRGVWHLDEDGTGTRYDSTSNNHNMTPSSYDNDEATDDGRVGGADDFDGTNAILVGPSSNDITGDNLQTITYSAWVKHSHTGDNGYISSLKRSSSDSTLISLDSSNTGAGNLGFLTRNNADSSHTWKNHDGGYNDSEWHCLVGTVSGLTRTLYVDGYQRGETDSDGIQSVTGNTATFTIGGFSTGSLKFDGVIDEVRISDIARSADWIEAEYLTIIESFITYGAEEDPSGESEVHAATVNIEGYIMQVNGGEIKINKAKPEEIGQGYF